VSLQLQILALELGLSVLAVSETPKLHSNLMSIFSLSHASQLPCQLVEFTRNKRCCKQRLTFLTWARSYSDCLR